MRQGMLGKAIAAVVAIAVVLNLTFSFIAEFVTWVACGARPTAESFFSGLWLAVTGSSTAYTAPTGCELPRGAIMIADYVAVAVVVAIAVAAYLAYRRYKESDRAF